MLFLEQDIIFIGTAVPMANYKPVDPGFKLIPFIQNKTNSVSFFLISPYNDKTVLNFFIDLEDYVCPDVFFDILSVAIDSLVPKKTKPSNKSEPARIKQAVKNTL